MSRSANYDQQVAVGLSPRVLVGEWRFVLMVIAGVLLLTSLPYAYAYATTPPDWRYMGIMVNVPDHVQYFSWFRELSDANLASNKLTPEPNAPVFFNLLWWMLGHAGRALGWDYAAMFQVLRVTVTVAFLLLLYRMCSWFLPDRLMRQTAFLIAIFASGFGWFLIVLKHLFGWTHSLTANLLIFIVEPNSFYAMLATPHLVGAALYMLAYDLILRGEVKQQLRYAVAAGLFTQFIGWQHSYDLLLVYGILAAYGLLKLARDRRLSPYLVWAGLIVGFLSFLPGLYSFLLTTLDPVWRDVLAQFDNAGVFTPNLLLIPVLMGPAFLLVLLILAKDGLFKLRGLDDNTLFLKAWFWGTFLLIYLPTNYQIKMLNGWQVPIAIIATRGLFDYGLPWFRALSWRRGWNWREEVLRRCLATVFLVSVIPTNLYLWTWRFVDLGRHTYPYYLTVADVEALEWLASQGSDRDVVLASLTLGQYVPALTGKHAFLAHWAQTVDYYTKQELVTEFYDPLTSNVRRQAILEEYAVDFVIYSVRDRERGDAHLSDVPLLQRVYTTPAIEIYQYKK